MTAILLTLWMLAIPGKTPSKATEPGFQPLPLNEIAVPDESLLPMMAALRFRMPGSELDPMDLRAIGIHPVNRNAPGCLEAYIEAGLVRLDDAYARIPRVRQILDTLRLPYPIESTIKAAPPSYPARKALDVRGIDSVSPSRLIDLRSRGISQAQILQGLALIPYASIQKQMGLTVGEWSRLRVAPGCSGNLPNLGTEELPGLAVKIDHPDSLQALKAEESRTVELVRELRIRMAETRRAIRLDTLVELARRAGRIPTYPIEVGVMGIQRIVQTDSGDRALIQDAGWNTTPCTSLACRLVKAKQDQAALNGAPEATCQILSQDVSKWSKVLRCGRVGASGSLSPPAYLFNSWISGVAGVGDSAPSLARLSWKVQGESWQSYMGLGIGASEVNGNSYDLAAGWPSEASAMAPLDRVVCNSISMDRPRSKIQFLSLCLSQSDPESKWMNQLPAGECLNPVDAPVFELRSNEWVSLGRLEVSPERKRVYQPEGRLDEASLSRAGIEQVRIQEMTWERSAAKPVPFHYRTHKNFLGFTAGKPTRLAVDYGALFQRDSWYQNGIYLQAEAGIGSQGIFLGMARYSSPRGPGAEFGGIGFVLDHHSYGKASWSSGMAIQMNFLAIGGKVGMYTYPRVEPNVNFSLQWCLDTECWRP
jgi:hypothetical protein